MSDPRAMGPPVLDPAIDAALDAHGGTWAHWSRYDRIRHLFAQSVQELADCVSRKSSDLRFLADAEDKSPGHGARGPESRKGDLVE